VRETKKVARALYRKYRSKSLGEIVGQSHVTDILARALSEGRIAHAYLLTGPRGVGKTSIARILAHEINQLPYKEDINHLDIIEIDAASNNGVEDVRDLREKVQIAPVSARKKVYIIDEVHMLSKAAFNALLKTLEEPPEHAVFILATTDSDKLPPTIISRTQRFNFRAITTTDAAKHLRHIADQEKIKISDDALELVASRGEGSFRDSISLLDQLQDIVGGQTEITQELVEQSLGLAPSELVVKLLGAYEAKDLTSIVALLEESEKYGIEPNVLTSQLLQTVQRRITENPQLLALLDQLLEVSKSSQPKIKLLIILGSHAAVKPKTAPLIAPPLEISAPVAELEKQATRQNPTMPNPDKSKPSASNSLDQRDTTKGWSRSTTTTNKHLQPQTHEAPVPSIDPGVKPLVRSGDRKGEQEEVDLDWQKLIDYTRQNYVAVYSVLSKCSHEITDGKLLLYTGNNFYKKKLDDSKHRINLQKSLEENGGGGLEIETIPTPPPPKDSTAAAVAAIMGGGEEVSADT
jgi:DNA polymerase III subunit gamma/tau